MNSGGGGRCGKNRWIIFFPLLTNEERPRPPLLTDPPPSAHAHLGGGRILKARPPRLRQCAQQRTPRGERTSEPAALALNHPPTTLGTMAAVAAASAELLIIGWYIFRVLLQVSVPGCWVGEGRDVRPLNRQARVTIAASRPVLS